MILAEPLHPYGAMLMARWMASADGGQPVLAAGGKSPTHPDVSGQEIAPVPETQYPLLPDDIANLFPTWDELSDEEKARKQADEDAAKAARKAEREAKKAQKETAQN